MCLCVYGLFVQQLFDKLLLNTFREKLNCFHYSQFLSFWSWWWCSFHFMLPAVLFHHCTHRRPQFTFHFISMQITKLRWWGVRCLASLMCILEVMRLPHSTFKLICLHTVCTLHSNFPHTQVQVQLLYTNTKPLPSYYHKNWLSVTHTETLTTSLISLHTQSTVRARRELADSYASLTVPTDDCSFHNQKRQGLFLWWLWGPP